MHIINLQAENYKRLKAVNITPDGRIVEITGKNRQGKTSILDAIWAALVGGEVSRSTAQPIREGEKFAEIRVDLGEYIVIRRFTKNDAGTLTVESPRGARYPSPQTLLDEIVGRRTMDPLAFVRSSAKEQVGTLVGILGDSLGFDPDALEKERAEIYEERTAANREAKRLAAVVDGMPEVPSDTPLEPISVSELVVEGGRIRRHNEEQANLRAERFQAGVAHQRATEAVNALREQLAKAEEDLEFASETLSAAELAFSAFEPLDEAPVLEKLATADEINSNVRLRKAREVAMDELQRGAEYAESLTAKLEEIAQRKRDGLANANLPLEGLAFDENGVTYNGVPLSQASSAEKRIVSFAIAVASNPAVRVVRMDEGESLDSEALAHIAELAEQHDYQVWITRVDESGQTGIVIEDGTVVE